MTIPAAPKKSAISFSLLGTKKPAEKPSITKIEPLDYATAAAQFAKPKDGVSGLEDPDGHSSSMDLDDDLTGASFSAAGRYRATNGTSDPSTSTNSNADAPTDTISGNQDDDEEDDPLDSFMADMNETAEKLKQESVRKAALAQNAVAASAAAASRPATARASESGQPGDEKAKTESEEVDDIQKLAQVNARKTLEVVDHTKLQYEPFTKSFYIEVPELAKMTEDQVADYRLKLEGVRIRGKNCPRPVKTFAQSGLSGSILERLKELKYERPTPIQAQALPAIMSGRDVIGIAKTGSGKTLAFLLPLMRHILSQRDLSPGEGPIGLIMVPTRELATQIHSDLAEFRRACGIVSCCIYGGADMGSQIGDLKRGAHVVVCTPGRMIEMLTLGRVTNLKRVTFLIIDEADRMFDLGFEQQIMKIVNNVRPDRQTVMFSATFPRQVEAAARKILTTAPLEITVHGRSVVSDTITQIVEVLDHNQKFYRLMELISEWHPKGSILVFAESQTAADMLFANVVKSGYDASSFHAGRDQLDRDETIERFKSGDLKIMIATSGASRGLDVPGLKLVVNYDAPNHLEDYVHRVGRTGRAGAKGTAITFIAPDEERYAGDLLKALKASNSPDIPEALTKMASDFEEKQKKGVAARKHNGFVGKGYQFNEEEAQQRKAAMNSVKLHFGGDLAQEALQKDDNAATAGDDDDDSEDTETSSALTRPSSTAPGATSSGSKVSSSSLLPAGADSTLLEALVPESELSKMSAIQRAAAEKFNSILIAKAQQQAQETMGSTSSQSAALSQGHALGGGAVRPKTPEQHFDDEIEVNDFPQQVRRRVTSKETFAELIEATGVAITPKGIYVVPGKPVPPGERKLYLSIEGPSAEAVLQARNGIRAVLETGMVNFNLRGDRPAGRYQFD